MNNISILLVDDNNDFALEMKALLSKENGFSVVGIAGNGEEAVASFSSLKPNVVILDLVMPKMDGFGFMQSIVKGNAKIIVLSALSKDAFITKAMDLGADYYMKKPCSFRELTQRIREVSTVSPKPVRRDRDMDERISNIFISVGIPAHIKGYQFLREAIKMAVENPEVINSITKRLYPEVAKVFDTSASKVERAIRHAIEVAWNRGKIENINSLFGVKVYSHNEKPTNGEFIARMSNVVKQRLREAA